MKRNIFSTSIPQRRFESAATPSWYIRHHPDASLLVWHDEDPLLQRGDRVRIALSVADISSGSSRATQILLDR